MGATFDYKGPIVTLIKKLKYGNQPYLSKGIASFMGAQFVNLNWPLPDIIIPVPQSLSRIFTRGYNQAELLSETLSEILQCPVQKALLRLSGDYTQAALSKEQRTNLTGNSIRLKKKQMLQDKVILLIDDVMTTGSTLKRCAEALLEDCPNSIYALTACHTDINR
jgi:ComF family protein